MLTQHQLDQRRYTVGASETYDAMMRPALLWRRKKLGEDQFDPEADFIRLGNAFEPALRDLYAAGRDIILSGSGGVPCSWVDPARPWLSMTPDSIICDTYGGMTSWAPGIVWCEGAHLLEIKTSSIWAPTSPDQAWADGRDWTPETPAERRAIPDRYRAQVVQMLGMTGLPCAVLIRLHFTDEAIRKHIADEPDLDARAPEILRRILKQGTAEIHTYRVEPDPALFEALSANAKQFIERYIVGDEIPPAGDNIDDQWAIQRHMHPRAGELVIDAGDDADAVLAHIAAHRAVKTAKAELERCELVTAQLIGDHLGIRASGQVVKYGNNGKGGRRWTMPKE